VTGEEHVRGFRLLSGSWLGRPYFVWLFCFCTKSAKGAPFPEALQYRVDAWSERSEPLIRLPVLKMRLIRCPRIGGVSDIKLIRTDTTLDLSQKAEKRWPPAGSWLSRLLGTLLACDGALFHLAHREGSASNLRPPTVAQRPAELPGTARFLLFLLLNIEERAQPDGRPCQK